MKLDDPAVVAHEYATETKLLARRSIYDTSEGPSALDVLWDRIAETRARDILEVGPGPGELSERLVAELGANVVAVDVSPRMVELTRARGIEAHVGDVQALSFGDASFDLVVAAWVLFHPPDLHRALSEIERVLRTGGRLVAATNSVRHLAELWALVGIERTDYGFSAENGEGALRRHFADISVYPVAGWVTFPDTATARDYVASSIAYTHLADRVPALEGPLRVRRRNTIFVAEKAP